MTMVPLARKQNSVENRTKRLVRLKRSVVQGRVNTIKWSCFINHERMSTSSIYLLSHLCPGIKNTSVCNGSIKNPNAKWSSQTFRNSETNLHHGLRLQRRLRFDFGVPNSRSGGGSILSFQFSSMSTLIAECGVRRSDHGASASHSIYEYEIWLHAFWAATPNLKLVIMSQ